MKFDPGKAVEFLLARGQLPILYWLKKDILDVPVDREIRNLPKYAARVRLLESQKTDGSWKKRSGTRTSDQEKVASLFETLKNLFRLHDYGCSKEEERIRRSVRFLMSTQNEEGVFLGPSLRELDVPAYHALILEILCRFGLEEDERVQKGFCWIMKQRQEDGGWAIPWETGSGKDGGSSRGSAPKKKPRKHVKSRPSSHLITGIILKALVQSATWRKSGEAHEAGELLLKRFFQKDPGDQGNMTSRIWQDISYPFWSTTILSSLDALSLLGFPADNERIKEALCWLLDKQNHHGYWECDSRNSFFEDHLWVTLAVLRVMKRFGFCY